MSCKVNDRQSSRCLILFIGIGLLLGSSLGLTAPAMAQQDDPPEAVAMYNTAANMFKDKQYDLAIAQWSDLLEKHPGYSLRRDTQHYIGLAHYNLKQFDKAVQQFTSLRDSLPNIKDYRRSEKTLMYLAFSQYRVGKAEEDEGVESLQQSLKTYEQFLEHFSSSEMAAEALFFQGEAMYELNRVDPSADMLTAAADSYKQIIDDHPEAEIAKKARYAYGACLEETGDYKNAQDVYIKYIDEFPAEPFTDQVRLRNADTLLQLAMASKNSGDAERASAQFQSAEQIYATLAKNPEFEALPAALNQRAYCLLHLGQYGVAADLYAIIANDHPKFEFAESASIDAGKYYYIDGKLDVAEKWLTNVVVNNESQRAEATHWLCQVKLKKEEFTEALALATDALSRDAGAHQANLQMDAAEAMYEIPDRQIEAVQAFEKLVNDHPDHSVAPKALYYVAYGYMKALRYEDAIKTTDQFRKSYPDSEFMPDTLDVLAQSSITEQNYRLAKSTYDQLIADFPNHERVDWWQTRLGWASYLQAEYDGAIAMMSQDVLDMKDPVSISEAHYVIGSSQFELKNYVKAIDSLQASMNANPDRDNAGSVLLLAARAHSKLNEHAQATALAQKIWDNGQLPDAAYWLGEFAYRADDFKSAADHYNNVISSEQQTELLPDALYGLAWAQSSGGDTESALKSFDKLISDHPGSELVSDALIGRGKARRIAGNFAAAIKDLDGFLDGDRDERSRFQGTYERALCYVGMENWKSAIGDLETLTDASASQPDLADDVLFELAWSYQKDEQKEKALSNFQLVADNHTDSPHAAESNYHVGQQLYAQENFDAAIQRYQTALDGSTNARVGELAAYKKAWCHFKKSDYVESTKAFRLQTDEYPQGELHPVGLSMLAESHFQLKQHAEAVTVYKVAIPAIESSDVQNNVRILAPIHAAQSANKVKEYQAALDYAKIIIDNHADSDYAADAWYETGVAQKGLGNREAAVSAWENAMKESLGRTGARARCMIGEELFEDEKYEDAIRQFKLVIYGYGGTESADDIRPWQAFAAYEAARCNYVQVKSTENEEQRALLIKNARDLFQMLIDNNPNDQLAPDARKQIAVLDSLK